jgi:hypothetical protein
MCLTGAVILPFFREPAGSDGKLLLPSIFNFLGVNYLTLLDRLLTDNAERGGWAVAAPDFWTAG